MAKTSEERIGIVETEVDNLKGSDTKQWAIIERIQNRPPVWTTVILMAFSGISCSALTFAGMIIKFSAGK